MGYSYINNDMLPLYQYNAHLFQQSDHIVMVPAVGTVHGRHLFLRHHKTQTCNNNIHCKTVFNTVAWKYSGNVMSLMRGITYSRNEPSDTIVASTLYSESETEEHRMQIWKYRPISLRPKKD